MIFSPEYRRMLSDSAKWKIVSSVLEPECPVKYDAGHMKWLKTHTDSHSRFEAVFCLEGSVPVSLENQSYMCPPGTLALFNAGEKHANGYPPGSDAVHLWLMFVQKRIVARLVTVSNGNMNMGKNGLFVDNPGLYNLIVQEWGRLKDSSLAISLKRKRIQSLFMLLLIELIELDDNAENAENSSEGNSVQQRRIISLIEEHIRDTSGSGLTIEKLARIAGYSKFHFMRLFRQETGYKVHDYINLSRINRLEEMESSGCSQKEIAYALGFSCPSAYSHWRKKLFSRKSKSR